MELSRISKIDLREAWPHEANDFTKWLAQPENISLLSEEIGISINVLQTEAEVGRFNVDILAEEEETEHRIIIENQLEYTDHSHLGQVITYAAGLEAKYIIWIVRDVHEEHRQAVDWLNEHTDDDINFFLIVVELWQIGKSAAAPKFAIVSKPNNWKKAMARESRARGDSGIELFRIDFWTGFHEYLSEIKSELKPPQPKPNHYLDMSLGISGRHISFIVNTKKNAVACDLWMNNKELFHRLYNQKDQIEKDLGLVGQLRWHELPEKKTSLIRADTPCDLKNKEAWKEGYIWLASVGMRFKEVFSKIK